MTIGNFKAGDRVQLHPRLDLWIRGARYGTVSKVGRKYVHVHLDVVGRVVHLLPGDLTHAF